MADTTRRLQCCLDRLLAGDETARKELVVAACGRLARLARKMFRAEGRLRGWAETGDVFQNAMLRLCRALQGVRPASPQAFFRLAAVQIRRELIDLARTRGRSPTAAALPAGSPPPAEPADWRDGPDHLAVWSEFHEQIGTFPEEERAVFDLVLYQGLTHAEAGQLLNVSTKTVQRRWHAGCLKLRQALPGAFPDLE